MNSNSGRVVINLHEIYEDRQGKRWLVTGFNGPQTAVWVQAFDAKKRLNKHLRKELAELQAKTGREMSYRVTMVRPGAEFHPGAGAWKLIGNLESAP